MKNKVREINILNSDLDLNKDQKKNNLKTTDINILLNRVRLDKKRTFKKRIIFSFFLVFGISFLTSYFII